MAYNLGLSQSANFAYNIGGLSAIDGGNAPSWADYNGSNDKTPVSFANEAYRLESVRINDDSFAIVYNTFSEEVKLIVATMNGSIPVFGTAVTLASGDFYAWPAISILDETHIICTWSNDADGTCEAVVAVISGNTVTTIGTPVVVDTDASNCWITNVAGLSSTTALVINRRVAAADCRVTNLSISGTVITKGTSITYRANDPTAAGITIQPLSSTRALILSTYATGVEVEAKLVNIVANSPNILSTLAIKDAALAVSHPAIGVIDSTHAVVGYFGQDAADKVYTTVVTATSDVLAKGTEIVAMTSFINNLTISVPTPNYVMVLGENNGGTNYLKRAVLGVSGTSLTAYPTYTTESIYYNAYSVAVNSRYIAVGYIDLDASDTDYVQILTP